MGKLNSLCPRCHTRRTILHDDGTIKCEHCGILVTLSKPLSAAPEGPTANNISNLHPVDEFVCSRCGLALHDWTRIVTDEDADDIYYTEYEFKYCPECGAKIVEPKDEGK